MTPPNSPNDERTLAALRYVLTAALDRETACACLEGTRPNVSRLPSGPYRLLAAIVARSPSSFRRCARLVEASLGPAIFSFERMTGPALVELVESGVDALEPRERAALVWSMLRRRDPALGRVLGALTADAA